MNRLLLLDKMNQGLLNCGMSISVIYLTMYKKCFNVYYFFNKIIDVRVVN